jgi:hypothetical protein
MSPMKQKISLAELKDRFNGFLDSSIPGKEIDYFGRDSIVEVLEDEFEHISPPFPKLLPFWDRRKVSAYYSGRSNETSFDAAHKEKEILVSVFNRFLAEKGDSTFILFSGAFYDDPTQEETKAFQLSLNYDFTQFVEEEALTGLMASDDTIICSEDFSNILIFFHHDLYELYDKSFKIDFSAFAARQRVSLRKGQSQMTDVWVKG